MPPEQLSLHPVTIFKGLYLPEEDALLAGYSALIMSYNLQIPLPNRLSAISNKHSNYQRDGWMMFSTRTMPRNTFYAHLTFALKHEGVNLAILKSLFDTIQPDEVIKIVKMEPTSSYSRRIWFLYEWLQGKQLDLPDADVKNAKLVDLLDSKLQYPGPVRISKRHRVRNNLPGVPDFCPIIQRTERLDQFIKMNLSEKANKSIGSIHPDILMRAAAFMLLKDSKASYFIEGETPPQTRAERWGRAIGQAGKHPLTHDEFLRLQEIVISDFRFTHYGYRNEGGFVGEHERSTGQPIPAHISARSEDLIPLMDGIIKTDELLKESDFDPVLAAAIIAFGFVFIHPFEDGNGRIHRYLIHHVLAEKHFTPAAIVFPISSVILEHIENYRSVLESYSQPRLNFIKWKPTELGNIAVLNETADLYRYFDATEQAEFLYQCILETIDRSLPDEIDYLKKYDEMKRFVTNTIDMPDRVFELLIRFLNQGNGKLSKRARQKEFSALTEAEIEKIEFKYDEIFHLK